MHRFWLDFGDASPSLVGVTAHDLPDALRIVARRWYDGGAVPAPVQVTVDIDVSTLPMWVQANMVPPIWHGVWYPTASIEPVQEPW